MELDWNRNHPHIKWKIHEDSMIYHCLSTYFILFLLQADSRSGWTLLRLCCNSPAWNEVRSGIVVPLNYHSSDVSLWGHYNSSRRVPKVSHWWIHHSYRSMIREKRRVILGYPHHDSIMFDMFDMVSDQIQLWLLNSRHIDHRSGDKENTSNENGI